MSRADKIILARILFRNNRLEVAFALLLVARRKAKIER